MLALYHSLNNNGVHAHRNSSYFYVYFLLVFRGLCKRFYIGVFFRHWECNGVTFNTSFGAFLAKLLSQLLKFSPFLHGHVAEGSNEAYRTVALCSSRLLISTAASTADNHYWSFFRRWCKWMTTLLLLSGQIKTKLGPALLAAYQRTVQTRLLQHEIIPTRSDGQCLLHLVNTFIRYYLGINISTDDIIKLAYDKLVSNFVSYGAFIGVSHPQYAALLKQYDALKNETTTWLTFYYWLLPIHLSSTVLLLLLRIQQQLLF